jgi:hypothetical protein
MTRFTSKLAVGALALVLSSSGLALTQGRTAAADPLSCPVVAGFVAGANDLIVDKLASCTVGEVFEINNRKKVRIDGVLEVSAEGCEVRVVIAVTLQRKLLRDVSGTVTARATAAADLTGDDLAVAFDDIRISSINLAHVGEVREWFFERIANRVLPNTHAISIDIDPDDGEPSDPDAECRVPR